MGRAWLNHQELGSSVRAHVLFLCLPSLTDTQASQAAASRNMPKECLPSGGQRRCHSAQLQGHSIRVLLLSELRSLIQLALVADTYNLCAREAERGSGVPGRFRLRELPCKLKRTTRGLGREPEVELALAGVVGFILSTHIGAQAILNPSSR